MYEFAANPTIGAIISVGGWPMDNGTAWKEFLDANPNVTTVVADASLAQFQLMSEGYADAIIGQLPYQMGEFVVTTLLDILQGRHVRNEVFGTHLLELIRVPLELRRFIRMAVS